MKCRTMPKMLSYLRKFACFVDPRIVTWFVNIFPEMYLLLDMRLLVINKRKKNTHSKGPIPPATQIIVIAGSALCYIVTVHITAKHRLSHSWEEMWIWMRERWNTLCIQECSGDWYRNIWEMTHKEGHKIEVKSGVGSQTHKTCQESIHTKSSHFSYLQAIYFVKLFLQFNGSLKQIP